MYTIIGAGAIGVRVALMLRDRGASVTLVEDDPTRASGLEGHGLRLIVADPRKVDLGMAAPAGTKAVLLAVGDQGTSEAAVRRLREFSKELIIIAISSLEGAGALRDSGADVALDVPEVISSSLLKETDDLETRRLSQAILRVIRSSAPKGLAIFCHDNPDADTLASAWALQHICEQVHVKAVIHYVGVMNMPQSKELVKLLGVRVRGLTTAQDVLDALASHSKLAMVDMSRPGENNSLPPTAVPDIVVDHHSSSEPAKLGEAFDIRGNVGSTSTLMTSHLINLGVPMDVKLATALFYGIKTDTDGFTTNVSTMDLMAAAYLSAYVYRPLLEMFELPPMPSSTMDALGMALGDREVRRHVSIGYLGELPDRSALPVAVDLLMQEDGVQTAVALAVVGDTLQLSARNKDKRIHVGEAVHLAFKGMGSAGGHASSAGGQLRIDALDESKDRAAAVERAKAILFEALK